MAGDIKGLGGIWISLSASHLLFNKEMGKFLSTWEDGNNGSIQYLMKVSTHWGWEESGRSLGCSHLPRPLGAWVLGQIQDTRTQCRQSEFCEAFKSSGVMGSNVSLPLQAAVVGLLATSHNLWETQFPRH